MWTFWLVIMTLLIILEISTVNLVSIWFIASALCTMILSVFVSNIYLQFTLFSVLGLILLFTTKPIIDKYLVVKREKTNLDRVEGMEGVVTERIEKHKIGEVKVDGKKWSAVSTDEINEGEEIIVLKIEGVKLLVRKVGK